MLLLDIDVLLSKYSWLSDMVKYVKRLNHQVATLEGKHHLTKKEKTRLKNLYANLRLLNPAIDFYVECGLRNPKFLCMYMYYEYKESLRNGANPDARMMFRRIKKDYFKEMREFLKQNRN